MNKPISEKCAINENGRIVLRASEKKGGKMSFFKKYFSRKLIVTTIVAPLLTTYAQSHGWPDSVTISLLGLLGVGVVGQAAVDTANANKGFKQGE